MRKKIFILYLLFSLTSIIAQKKKNEVVKLENSDKIINTINCRLAPQNGKEFSEDNSYSQKLLDKYEIKLESVKVNSSTKTCVFNFSEEGSTESNPAELSIGQSLNYIPKKNKTLTFKVTFIRFHLNKKIERASEVSVKIEIIKLKV